MTSKSKSFDKDNIFTAQLSDAFGDFTSPVNIGTLTSNVKGNFANNKIHGKGELSVNNRKFSGYWIFGKTKTIEKI